MNAEKFKSRLKDVFQSGLPGLKAQLVSAPPFRSSTFTVEDVKVARQASVVWLMYPEEGELMLWQSNLTHGYSDNQKDGRISISMNFMPSLIVDDKYSYRVSTT